MLDKFFLLNWKRVLAIIVAWLAAVILHNAVYALFFDYFSRTGGDEPVFFILAGFVIPLYFVVSLAYTAIRIVRNRYGEQAS